MTAGIGLTLMPECQCWTEEAGESKNADEGLTFYRHSRTLPMIFKHHTSSITPSSVVFRPSEV
jgi:hypothetical protein